MLANWGSLPSGDLTIDYGAFDKCLNKLPITATGISVHSQYCVVGIRLNALRKRYSLQLNLNKTNL